MSISREDCVLLCDEELFNDDVHVQAHPSYGGHLQQQQHAYQGPCHLFESSKYMEDRGGGNVSPRGDDESRVSGALGAGAEAGDAVAEGVALLVEREESWVQCRPLRGYMERLSGAAAASASKRSPKRPRTSCGCRNHSRPPLLSARTRGVQWILHASNLLHLCFPATCQAVAYLDRFLANQIEEVGTISDVRVAAAACLWIAIKMDGLDAPTAESLACAMGEKTVTLEAMEARVLRALQWRLLVVTTVDFMDCILQIFASSWCQSSSASASASLSSTCVCCCNTTRDHALPTIPGDLIQPLQQRAHEILQGVLLEVCFVGYKASLVAICAIQFVLEELMPIQAPCLLHFLYKIFAPMDMATLKECYETMGDLVIDPYNINLYLNSSPDRVLQASTLIL